jgi:cephalosporin hydroxylase
MSVVEQTVNMSFPLQKYKVPEGMTKQGIIDEFHKLYYHAGFEEGLGWMRTQWYGTPLGKSPFDLLSLADVLWRVKPQLVIETGTDCGGSALFMGTYLDMFGKGKVLSIDLKDVEREYPAHPRVAYLGGKSSVSPVLLKEVQGWVDYYGAPIMVVLDSDHREPHVAAELEAYANFVTPGSYLIVEDTNVNGHPVLAEHGPGPYEAVEKWLPEHPEFQEDKRQASLHMFSMHTWLRRVRT